MSEWHPEIVIIEKIEKHPNADNLSIAIVLGDYPIVIRTGEYKENDKAFYFPLDTVVPDTEQFHFLSPVLRENYEDENGNVKSRITGYKYPVGLVPEKYRIIKAKKIRDVYSQGMLVPLANPETCQVGDSIIEMFSLKKWEEPDQEEQIVKHKSVGANAKSPPKGWALPYYDIEGLRKYVSCIKPDEEIVLTEKLNGSNAVFVYDGEELWVKSRNFFKKENELDEWWDAAYRMNLKEKLSKYPMLAFWGELTGKVKNFRYDAQIVDGKLLTKIYFFDIYDIQNKKFLDYDEFLRITTELELPVTPELFRGHWIDKETMYAYAEGKDVINPKQIREGFVLKPTKERFEPKLNGRMQLKLVGEGYNLSK